MGIDANLPPVFAAPDALLSKKAVVPSNKNVAFIDLASDEILPCRVDDEGTRYVSKGSGNPWILMGPELQPSITNRFGTQILAPIVKSASAAS